MNQELYNVRNNEYVQLKAWRHHSLQQSVFDHDSLQLLHEKLMIQVIQIALSKIESEWGSPPTPFSFFVMGSAGRSEQGVSSDQDHGIIFQDPVNDQIDMEHQWNEYFMRLGTEISTGLSIAGYEKCDGNIMASNPKWCMSKRAWLQQSENWLELQDWASIRHLLILFDGTALVGKAEDIHQIKAFALEKIRAQPQLFERLVQNTQHRKKYIGVFGQFYTESHGPYSRCLNLKQAAFFPFIHSVRLLCLKFNILQVTSTKQRLEALIKLESEQQQWLQPYYESFVELVNLRTEWQLKHDPLEYENSHYIPITELPLIEKKKLKKIVQDAYRLSRITTKLLSKD